MDSEKPLLSREADGVRLDSFPLPGFEEKLLDSSSQIVSNRKTAPKVKIRKAGKLETREVGVIAHVCAWIVRHQIGIAVNLLLLLSLTHLCFPRARQFTRKFFTLSHFNPDTGRYAVGWDDMCMVCFSLTIFTGLRIFVMEYIMAPFVQYMGLSRKEQVRIAEQAWICVYPAVSFSVGLYIMSQSDYWFNFRELWTNWPDREIDGFFKLYYLVQFSFWLQQIVVVNIEERRKDYAQMFTHHVVTCLLMFTSYAYHYTKVGNVILCIMDSADILLPLAKLLKYMKFRVACDIAFGVFMLVWLISRHLIYGGIIWSIFTDYYEVAQFGCFKGSNANLQGPFPQPSGWMHFLVPLQDPEGIICQTKETTYAFVFLLLFLQSILLVWFAMIVTVAIKVIRGQGADDIRSDDEDEDVEIGLDDRHTDEQMQYIEVPPLEEEVGVESINFATKKNGFTRKTSRRSHGTSSGVGLPSDKKELLGRIGCDKTT